MVRFPVDLPPINLLLAHLQVALAVMGGLSCEFVKQTAPGASNPFASLAGDNANANEAGDMVNATDANGTMSGAGGTDPSATIGLIYWSYAAAESNGTHPAFEQYIPSVTEDGCNRWSLSAGEYPYLYASRVMALIGIIAAGIGFIYVFFEACCVRMCCASIFETGSYLLALLGIAMSFLVFGSSQCLDWSCSIGTGSTYMIVALACILLANVVLCCATKPTPLVQKLCGGRKKGDHDDVSGMEQQTLTEAPRIDTETGDVGGIPAQTY